MQQTILPKTWSNR